VIRVDDLGVVVALDVTRGDDLLLVLLDPQARRLVSV
jgi:hypothetical protein